jgi:tetratricopeptide (TPR) repeat protein
MAGGQDAAPSPQEQFNKAAEFMEKGQFAEAVPILEALAEEYESENVLWNLGIAATEIHENDKALKVWLQYRKLAPDDWRGRAKLVQAYQATGNMKARDEERAALISLWERGDDADLKKQETFCREQIIEADLRVFVFEHFRPAGEFMVIYSFEVRAPGAEDYRVSLGSYEGTNQVGWETGSRPRNVRLYHLDLYRPKFHATYAFYEGQPAYETVRENVLAILSGKANPLSSTQQQ